MPVQPAYTSEEFFEAVQGCVHPVVLEYDDEDYSLHGVGTSFIVEHCGALFAISAQHILRNQRAKVSDFHIFLRKLHHSLQFDREVVFHEDFLPHFDLLILRIAPDQLDIIQEAGVHWIKTEDNIQVEEEKEADNFYVFGYPESGREYDYENRTLSAGLAYLVGSSTASTVDGLSTIKVEESSFPFRGLSGSLVVANMDGIFKFAGMTVLASEESKLINYIPASTIIEYLDEASLLELKGEFLNTPDADIAG